MDEEIEDERSKLGRRIRPCQVCSTVVDVGSLVKVAAVCICIGVLGLEGCNVGWQ
jgi:hypothetical protein